MPYPPYLRKIFQTSLLNLKTVKFKKKNFYMGQLTIFLEKASLLSVWIESCLYILNKKFSFQKKSMHNKLQDQWLMILRKNCFMHSLNLSFKKIFYKF